MENMKIYILIYANIDTYQLNNFNVRPRCFTTLEQAKENLKRFRNAEIEKCKAEESDYEIVNDDDNLFTIEVNGEILIDACIVERELNKG